jgi:hypothetical protein
MSEPRRCGSAVAPADDVDLVPDATSDEHGEGWGEDSSMRPENDAAYDELILRERPPHHGG